VVPDVLLALIFAVQFPLGQEPMLNITPLGASALDPNFVRPLANKATSFQRSRCHLMFIGKFVEHLQCSAVVDPAF
jgi:hypothetical protein